MRKLLFVLVTWKKEALISCILCCLFLCSCTYKADVQPVTTATVYSSYDEKIGGNIAVLVEHNDLFKCADAGIYADTPHKFPMDITNSLVDSVIMLSKQLFDNSEYVLEQPSIKNENKKLFDGTLIVKGKHFEPRLQFKNRFWDTPSAEADIEIAFDFTVKDKYGNTLIYSTVKSTGETIQNANSDYSGGAKALSVAASKALEDCLEQMAEKISNSEKVRKYLMPTQR